MSWDMPAGFCVDTSAYLEYRSMTWAGAVIHPIREPGAMTLENESMRITRPSVSMER